MKQNKSEENESSEKMNEAKGNHQVQATNYCTLFSRTQAKNEAAYPAGWQVLIYI